MPDSRKLPGQGMQDPEGGSRGISSWFSSFLLICPLPAFLGQYSTHQYKQSNGALAWESGTCGNRQRVRHSACLQNFRPCAAATGNSMAIPQTTKNKITIWSRNPIPGHISNKIVIQKTHTPLSSQQHSSWHPRHGNNLNVHRRMDKGGVVYIYNGILLSHKEEWCHLQQHGCNWRLSYSVK